MRRYKFLGLRSLVPLCTVIVLAVNWQQAFSSSSAHQQPVHPENAPHAVEETRLYGPPALSASRRHAALQIFEKVHPTLTIHYNGFSRQGSVICYDLLNELRTVEEARALMDVEFHLLDLMLEHYKVKKHMRIVDANIVRRMLHIGNLFSFKFAETITNVTRFIKDYEPILRVFLKRYEPHIELLVIVNVPTFLVPFLPTLAARIMGISSRKIVAIANGSALERFMEKRYIPREFGNPTGLSVKHNDEDITASCLMLKEIKAHLGESALTSHGKKFLAEHGPRLLAGQVEPSTTSSKLPQKVSKPAQPKESEVLGELPSDTSVLGAMSIDDSFDDIE